MESSAIAAPPAPAAPPPGAGPAEASRSDGGFARHMRRAEERPEANAAARPEPRSPATSDTAPGEVAEPERPTEAASTHTATPDEISDSPAADAAGATPEPPALLSVVALPFGPVAPDAAAGASSPAVSSGPAEVVPVAVLLPVPVALAPAPIALAATGAVKAPAPIAPPPPAEAVTVPVLGPADAAAPALPAASAAASSATAAPTPAPAPAGTAPPETANAPPPTAAAPPAQATTAAQILAAIAPVRRGQVADATEPAAAPIALTAATPSANDPAPETRPAPGLAAGAAPIEAATSHPLPDAASRLPHDTLPGEPKAAGEGLVSPSPGTTLAGTASETTPGIAGPPAPAAPPATAPVMPLTEPPRAAPPAPPARQIAPLTTALASGTRDGESATISVSLDPGELGRVEISVERNGGQTAIRVIVERAETLALLQRDQRELGQSLTQAGVDESGRSISFSLSGQGGGQRQGQPPPGQHGAALPWTAAADPRAAAVPDNVRPRVARSLLDLAL